MKFETHCKDGQPCGAVTTGCQKGQCQRRPAIDRGEAVNLAQHIVRTPRARVTGLGLDTLARAVLDMDREVNMSNERKPPDPISLAIATGRCCVNYDPLAVLRELSANISYISHAGFVIVLGKGREGHLHKRIMECLAFHDGEDTVGKELP